jgi:hypothetical protein
VLFRLIVSPYGFEIGIELKILEEGLFTFTAINPGPAQNAVVSFWLKVHSITPAVFVNPIIEGLSRLVTPIMRRPLLLSAK